MSNPRIVVLEPIAGVGGAEISLLELIRRLRNEVEFVLILPEDGPLRSRAEQAGARVRILPWPARLMRAGERAGGARMVKWGRAVLAGTALLGLARRVGALVRELRADLLLTNGIKAHVIGALAARRARAPLVWYLRDGLEGRPLTTLALRAVSRRCAGAIAISRYVEKEARVLLPSKTPIAVIYNLVDFTRFTPSAPPPGDLRKAPGEIWYTIVGALTPLKGQDIFLAAAAVVAERLPQARFVIMGSSFYRTEQGERYESILREIAALPALKDRVRFLGQRDDVSAVLRLTDVLVQPNREPEALGRSILEAMACGVAIIATDRWGPAELIQHERTGLLTPALDVPALSEKMVRLGGSSQERARLAAAAVTWVTNELNEARILGQIRGFLGRWIPSAPGTLP